MLSVAPPVKVLQTFQSFNVRTLFDLTFFSTSIHPFESQMFTLLDYKIIGQIKPKAYISAFSTIEGVIFFLQETESEDVKTIFFFMDKIGIFIYV